VGGRRAKSVTEIVGTGLVRERRQLSKAISEADPGAVAVSSAKLLAGSKKVVDVLYYAAQLSNFVSKVVESGRDIPHAERLALARKEWSRIKRAGNLPDDPIVTNAIVSAAAYAIAKGRK
jgi:hypothetical protein